MLKQEFEILIGKEVEILKMEKLTTLEKEKVLACIGYFVKDFEVKSNQEQYDFYRNLKSKLEIIL